LAWGCPPPPPPPPCCGPNNYSTRPPPPSCLTASLQARPSPPAQQRTRRPRWCSRAAARTPPLPRSGPRLIRGRGAWDQQAQAPTRAAAPRCARPPARRLRGHAHFKGACGVWRCVLAVCVWFWGRIPGTLGPRSAGTDTRPLSWAQVFSRMSANMPGAGQGPPKQQLALRLPPAMRSDAFFGDTHGGDQVGGGWLWAPGPWAPGGGGAHSRRGPHHGGCGESQPRLFSVLTCPGCAIARPTGRV